MMVQSSRLYVVIVNDAERPYIAGVFTRSKRVHAYIQEIRGTAQVTKVEHGFPLLVLEDSRGFRFFDEDEIGDAISEYRAAADFGDKDQEHAILYRFEKSYRPEVPRADEMGRVWHVHITTEWLDRSDT